MNMLNRAEALVLCLVAMALPAAGETLVLSSQSLTGVYSGTLTAGTIYEITVSGTYDYGNAPDTYADAEWSRPPNWSEVVVGYARETDILDVVINNTPVDWFGSADGVTYAPHVFSPVHTYKYWYTGTGVAVNFHIADLAPWGGDATGDNEGTLSLDIRAVPEPSNLITMVLGFGWLGGMLRPKRR